MIDAVDVGYFGRGKVHVKILYCKKKQKTRYLSYTTIGISLIF